VSAVGRRAGALGAVLLVVLLSGCGEEYLQSTINPVTDYGEVSQNLYVQVFWWAMIILAVVWALMAYILIRFRERPGRGEPKQIHGHMGLEIAWTIAPALIVVAIVIPTIQGVFQVQRPPDGDALIVEVTGKRYWWSFHYPELGVTTANELHLPVGRPVSLRLESGDVIHSFWVPQLGGKRDVNPVVRVPEGEEPKRNWMHFTIKEEGVFWGQCAEFCGEAHSLMGIRVVAETESDFQQWVEDWRTPAPTANRPEVVVQSSPESSGSAGSAAAPVFAATRDEAKVTMEDQDPIQDPSAGVPVTEDSLIAAGREAFFTRCIQCHAIQGTPAPGVIGPNLTRIGRRSTIAAGMLENTEENLIRWIRDPNSVKPGAQMPSVAEGVSYEGLSFPPTGLTEEQIRAVAAYLSSMK
jgi:cytochrome c oxidase subunit 2